jgi:plastocyanin
MERIGVGVGIIVLTLALAGPAAAYDAMAVSDGGTISGTITYGGAPPAAKTIKATKDTEACGATIPDEALMVDAGKGIKNVVVRITDIKKGKKWEAKPVLDQKKCHFQPHVLVVQAAQDMKILNSDGILHNIHTYSTANPSINVAQPKFKKEMTQKFAKPEIIKVTCDAHNWMLGWLVVSDHPYVAVTDEKGTYRLTDVPPGDYKVEVWHETLGKTEKTVKVAAKAEAKVDHTFAPK